MLATGVLFVVGCSRAPEPPAAPLPEVAAVRVVPASLSLEAGATAQLSAQINGENGQPIGGANIKYAVADPQVLRVSDRGLITALGPASNSTVIVASGRAETQVAVTVRPGALQRIEVVSGDQQSLRAGDIPNPLVVRLLDSWGNAIPGMTLSIAPAPETFPVTDYVSRADGIASIDAARLMHTGTVTITVHPKDRAGPTAAFNLQVLPAAPATLRLISKPGEATGAADSTESVQLQVTDTYENPIPDVAIRVQTSKADPDPILARTGNDGIALIALPRPPRSGRLAFEASVVDQPAVKAAFAITLNQGGKPTP